MADARAGQSTRFRKGTSGNPGGRPRKSPAPAPSAFDVLINRRLTTVTGGIERELTIDEALQQRTYQDALAGKRLAIRAVLKWIEKREAARPKPVAAARSIKLLHQQDPTNADAAMLVLGVVSERSDRPPENGRLSLQLEPWAVQRALARRTGEKLTSSNESSIKWCTRAPETIDWPSQKRR